MADYQPGRNYELYRAESLIKAGAICGGISLLIGGVFLDVIGIICIIVGIVKLTKVKNSQMPHDMSIENMFVRLAKIRNIAIAVCVLALAMNIYSLYILWPTITEILNSGDASSLYSLYGFSGNTNASNVSNTGSIWS